MHEYQRKILESALPARENEVIEYQVNIDNYERAIAKIGDDADLQGFKAQLQELRASALQEQRKAQIMLEVISEQLAQQASLA